MKYYISAKSKNGNWYPWVYHYDQSGDFIISDYLVLVPSDNKESAIDDASEWFEQSELANFDSETDF